MPISKRQSECLVVFFFKTIVLILLGDKITLHVHWFPYDWNQPADEVSKLLDGSDWRFHPKKFFLSSTVDGGHILWIVRFLWKYTVPEFLFDIGSQEPIVSMPLATIGEL